MKVHVPAGFLSQQITISRGISVLCRRVPTTAASPFLVCSIAGPHDTSAS